MTNDEKSPSAGASEAKPRIGDAIDWENDPEWETVGAGQGFVRVRHFGLGPVYQVNAYTGAIQEIVDASVWDYCQSVKNREA